MALDRIYGDYQTAGYKISTAAKSQVSNAGTDGYAQAVVLVDSSGVPTGGGDSFVNITTATTTVVKASAGTLARITVNTGGAGSSAVIYDNTAGSGTKVGTITTATTGTTWTFNAACATGITVVTSGGTPADITVFYR